MSGIRNMTRQQKKIVKKIEELEKYIEADRSIGRSSYSAGFYEPFMEKIQALQEQLKYLDRDSNTEGTKGSIQLWDIAKKLILVVYDAIIVNLSYFVAIIMRFSDADS